jgi:hypothetical protein
MDIESSANVFEPFAPEALAETQADRTCFCIAIMEILEFLRVAPPIPIRITTAHREKGVQAILDAGEGWATLPILCLEFDKDINTAYIVEHDGRHRAKVLLDRGVQTIPVMVFTEGRHNAAFEPTGRPFAIYPQQHDDDEDYPGMDEAALEARQLPVMSNVVFLSIVGLTEAQAALGSSAQTHREAAALSSGPDAVPRGPRG